MIQALPLRSSDAEPTPLVPGLVTVAIPARNEERSIGALLDRIRAQTHQNLQIVVVDGHIGFTGGLNALVDF